MNVSQSVASYIRSVDFGVLSSEEIHRVSVKRIQNPETFDTLLHPTPGGLYDLSLGAWGDYTCATCDLKTFTCPGHPGHIDLPVPLYNATYMDQLVRLLQSQCPFCFHFRAARSMVNLLICKLRLLQYGLVPESRQLDDLGYKPIPPKEGGGDDDRLDSQPRLDEDDLISVQNAFVKSAITKAGLRRGPKGMAQKKSEAVLEARRSVITEAMMSLTKPTKCGLCQGRPYRWRKDKYNKIFRDARGVQGKNSTNNYGQKPRNPLILELRAKRAATRQKKADREADEAIDLASDDFSDVGDTEDIDDAETDASVEDSANMNILNESAATATVQAEKASENKHGQFVNTEEVYAFVSALFRKERELLNLIYSINDVGKNHAMSADMFFIRTLLVPPNKYRPEAKASGQITEAQQNTLYKRILTSCVAMHQLQRELKGETDPLYRRRDFNDFQNAWVALQDCVNGLFDSERSAMPRRANKEPEEGIKQRLEKKEGLFRMNMMGKRVNFAARSVISPDPNIETNEIGVPPVFAKKLTFPEPVTQHNSRELMEAVMNGPNKWPGAAAIENENGQVISLQRKTAEERQALANQLLAPSSTGVIGSRNKKVHRHLNNGDIVIMNRQPTLHKPSMMCHRARVLPGEKTIRMHYANCNTYNADFDGDEMNMHFPQTQIARAEAAMIADTDHQYLVATSGKPLRGLIQDHLSMGVWLTNRDTIFDRGTYQQLLYSSLRPEDRHTSTEQIITIIPAIIKPVAMWTGKQVITTILKNLKPHEHQGLTMIGKSSTPAKAWCETSEEQTVIFQSGEFLCGILDKAHLGPTGGGFVHAIYEAYGNTIAGRLLSALGRLLTKFLHMRAWSCGIEDIVLSPSGDLNRWETLKDANVIGLEVASKYVSLANTIGSDDLELRKRLADVLRDKEKHAGLDSVYSTQNAKLSSAVTEVCLPNGLWKPFPRNHMQTMTLSGAKGSMVNANQISCNLGQQTLEGRRVPVMISGRTLPSFKPFETDIRAGGYIANRFLTGVQPQEYYFHAMAGREGLIDTAVKTARSGYLQRCLIKGMEGLRVEYDTSVRDSDGSMIQFLYGEDGLEVTKQKHLTDFKFICENIHSFILNINVKESHSLLEDKKISKLRKDIVKSVRKGKNSALDPIMARFNPGSNLGCTSETFALALKEYLDENPDNLIKLKNDGISDGRTSRKSFQSIMDMKYLQSLVEPGEAVGIVAGQSIGEPSTQMTLNTFHLAGHAAKNVTLGIPRLREIVMTASANILTPTMTLHLNTDVTEDRAQRFAKGMTKLRLAEVIESVCVQETVAKGKRFERARCYNVTLKLFPKEDLEEEYAITIQDVAGAITQSFLPKLEQSIKKDLAAKAQSKRVEASSAQLQIGVATQRVEQNADAGASENEDVENAERMDRARAEVDSEDENDPDDDATQAKMKSRNIDNYDDAEEENEEHQEAADITTDPNGRDEPEDEGYVGSPRAHEIAEHRPQNLYEAIIHGKSSSAVSAFRFNLDPGSRCDFTLEFDMRSPKIIMLNHVETSCRQALIQHIPGIGACTVSEEKIKDPKTKKTVTVPVVITEGINLVAMRDYQDDIDPHKILTNDIGAMLQYYGVEAARQTIIREMSAVFEGHSILVDQRHLNLIADMMTRHGTFVPFNRFGMKSSPSPFMRMSFETTVGFLKDAVLAGECDELTNPSARLVAGKTSGVGTGSFDVLVPVAAYGTEQSVDVEMIL